MAPTYSRRVVRASLTACPVCVQADTGYVNLAASLLVGQMKNRFIWGMASVPTLVAALQGGMMRQLVGWAVPAVEQRADAQVTRRPAWRKQ